jgi:glucokinase
MKVTIGPFAIGIDLGATKVAGALVNEQGEAIAEARTLTEAKAGVPTVVGHITSIVAQLLAQVPQGASVAGVGIGTPGIVDGATGVVRDAVNLGWREVALAHDVAAGIQAHSGRALPVWVENDANSQAVGEFVFGAGRGLDNFALLTIGTGLGGAIIANRQLIAGATYTASEIGHISLDPDGGRLCACGLRGCVETVASGPGLVKNAQEFIARGGTSALNGNFHAEDVVAAARQGDALAAAALAQSAQWLGIAFAMYVTLLNPAAIVIGGGLGLSVFDLLIPRARAELERRAIAPSLANLQIIPAQVMSSAIGAAALVWQQQ